MRIKNVEMKQRFSFNLVSICLSQEYLGREISTYIFVLGFFFFREEEEQDVLKV
jgi:hypothetical protein